MPLASVLEDDDEDAFVPPSDSERSTHSGRSRSRSSVRSASSGASYTEPSSQPQAKSKSRPSTKSGGKCGFTFHPRKVPISRIAAAKDVGGSGVSFLTAAEQRLANKKAEKKEKEEMYSFLKEDVLADVRMRSPVPFLFFTPSTSL
jgi:hypothetical protein